MFLGSLVGNVGVIVIVATSRRMRSAITAYLVNLAVADISILLLCMWVHLVQDLSGHRHYRLGAFWCRFNGFAQSEFYCARVKWEGGGEFLGPPDQGWLNIQSAGVGGVGAGKIAFCFRDSFLLNYSLRRNYSFIPGRHY